MSSLQTSIQILAATATLTLAIHAQTLNILHVFEENERGYDPQAGVVIGPKGELYGVTILGGAAGEGVVFEMVPPSLPGGTWKEAILHSFTSEEGQPTAGLAIGSGRELYGVTGYSVAATGSAFRLTPPGASGAPWTETVLQSFLPEDGTGFWPQAPLVSGPHQSLYGTTSSGDLFELTPPAVQGGNWSETVLYTFPGYPGDGEQPVGSLVFDARGDIYGVSESGGAYGDGTVFQLSPPAYPNGAWTEALLYSFVAQPEVTGLPNGVVFGADGALYGTTMVGPTAASKNCYDGCGAVFQLSPPAQPGGTWLETLLHVFGGDPNNDGTEPNSTLLLGTNGVLYGATGGGGGVNAGPRGGAGTIFEMVPPSSPGGSWTEVILYIFTGGLDGNGPNGVTFGQDGNLYGTTALGGDHHGTVFQLALQ